MPLKWSNKRSRTLVGKEVLVQYHLNFHQTWMKRQIYCIDTTSKYPWSLPSPGGNCTQACMFCVDARCSTRPVMAVTVRPFSLSLTQFYGFAVFFGKNHQGLNVVDPVSLVSLQLRRQTAPSQCLTPTFWPWWRGRSTPSLWVLFLIEYL